MENQRERLTALLVQKAEAAQQAQEESLRREERISKLQEGTVAQRPASPPSSASGSGGNNFGNDHNAIRDNSIIQQPRFPVTATTALHLKSSASLPEFDAWRHKF